ncbi:MAG: hypothetical protein AMXMBFR45_05700 [Gammaproteobacteria bacterium]|nr:MAG: hypothetical protein EDM71_07400 [Pseudomonadota bacterium]MBC6944979.1 hypothetical protein [Gammaproteobacteria bacterium]MCQ3934359.1 hypothetical protein [Gammaproteobacteria bacterium]MDL1881679.1 hypothetical protein [Gammaproteobacteria bacterium PRO2]GIK35503.1 MAG: hypothetical protein BroJett010_20620 [Gammaproteobacteria bacterium]
MAEAAAPGKLVICGEYAVLAGAPAIAIAVDVRARARVVASDGACRLDIPGAGRWAFDWGAAGCPQWRDLPTAGQGALLEAVAATLATAGYEPRQPLAIELDSSRFRSASGDKLGLGSSAALAVALVAAMAAASGRPVADREVLFRLAQAAHRRLQGGSGSGIDVAAAVHGGVVALAADARVETLAWPRGLHWLAAWSGSGAATPPLVSRFMDFRRDSGPAGAALLAPLRAAAAATLEAWRRGGARPVLAALAEFRQALEALDADAGIGIVTPAHQRLAALAADAGCFYKTAGAGGGDFGLLLADDAAAIVAAARSLAAAGIMTIGGGAGPISPASIAGVAVR